MSKAVSPAEVQLCISAKNIQKPVFTRDDLQAFGATAFKDTLEDWSNDFERLCALDIFRAEGENYSLTEESPEQHRSDVVRTFICIEISESIKERIDRLQTTLRAIEAQVSWTKPSNIHLTLKFLGGVQAARIGAVCKAVERAASEISPFEVEVGGAGCFPSPRNPRVLWVGFSVVPEPLKQLYANIEEELTQEGFPREKRKFSPHLTIGRIRTPPNAARVAEALIANSFAPETFKATEVIVMRSDLKPTGSTYTPQTVIRFARD